MTARALLVPIAVVALIAALIWTRPISVPLAVALFLIALTWPLQEALERVVPRWLALIGTISLVLLVLAGLIGLLGWGGGRVADGVALYGDRINATYRAFIKLAEERGLSISPTLAEQVDPERLLGLVQALFEGIYLGLAFIALTLVFLVLGLLEVSDFEAKLTKAVRPERRDAILAAVARIGGKLQRYMLVRTFVSVLTGLLTWLYALLVGLDLASVWGIVAFVLNYIPMIGSIIAVVPPVIFAVVQFGDWQTTLLVLVGLGAIQFTIGNYLDPRLEGRALAISPLVIILSILFWGLVWGVPGAFIGVPMTIAILTACERMPSLRWIPVLLGMEPGRFGRLRQRRANRGSDGPSAPPPT